MQSTDSAKCVDINIVWLLTTVFLPTKTLSLSLAYRSRKKFLIWSCSYFGSWDFWPSETDRALARNNLTENTPRKPLANPENWQHPWKIPSRGIASYFFLGIDLYFLQKHRPAVKPMALTLTSQCAHMETEYPQSTKNLDYRASIYAYTCALSKYDMLS